MKWSLAALIIGFCVDLLLGDPHGFPHPVVLIGRLISVLEKLLRRLCPKTPAGERAAGAILWGAVVMASAAAPAGRHGQSVAASGAGERDVLADSGDQISAR